LTDAQISVSGTAWKFGIFSLASFDTARSPSAFCFATNQCWRRDAYATAMIEILADNADPLAADLYAALDMPFAVLVGQIASALTKK